MCDSITTTQLFSRNALGFLWSKRAELDPGQTKIIQSLYNNKSKGLVEGSHKVTYKLSIKKAGKLGYGRLYGDIGSLETLEREARGTLCKDFYDDVDIVNAHPVILYQLAEQEFNTDLPELEKYIKNRTKYLHQISNNLEEAKKAVISVIYNGKCNFDLLEPLSREIKAFTKKISRLDRFQELFLAVSSEDNKYGSFLSYIVQTEERKIMLAMRDYFQANERSVDVLAYDGVMIRKTDKPLQDFELRACEVDILKKTKFEVSLLVKPFEFYTQDDAGKEIAPKVLMSEFLEKKALFEQNHFYHSDSGKIIEVSTTGELNAMCNEHATIYLATWDFRHSSYSADRTSFLKLWLLCNDRRTVKKISMKPSEDPDVFTVPLKFAYSQTTPESNDNVLRLFNTLLDLWANEDELWAEDKMVKRKYLVQYLAHMIQRPYEIPGVAIVVSGKMGSGKDTLANFLSQYVIGQQYSVNYTQTFQLFGAHDCGTMNKILVKIEEADGKAIRQNQSAMKSFITSPLALYNPKGMKEIQVESFNRFILTTNEANPVKIEQNDRRYFFLNCNSRYLGDRDFWNEVYKVLFNPSAGAIVGEWLASIDLSDFNVRSIPEDEYKDDLAEDEKTSIEKFVDAWDGIESRSTALFGNYKSFCIENSLNDFGDVRTFGKALQVFVRDLVIKRRIVDGCNLYRKVIPIPAVSQFVDDSLILEM